MNKNLLFVPVFLLATISVFFSAQLYINPVLFKPSSQPLCPSPCIKSSGQALALILLDLLAIFDTVDLSLFYCVCSSCGFQDSTLSQFFSYFTSCSFSVFTAPKSLSIEVPQGTVLNPHLSLTYADVFDDSYCFKIIYFMILYTLIIQSLNLLFQSTFLFQLCITK